MSALDFLQRLSRERGTLACAGIDPNPQRYPAAIRESKLSVAEQTRRFLKTYVEIAAPHVCAFKLQKAYFDVLHEGSALLKEVVAFAQDECDTPVIIDAKIGDIDETMKAYRDLVFQTYGAAGVVLNPYMGDDVLQAFDGDGDRILVVLARTSNAGAACVQDETLHSGRPVWRHVLGLCLTRWNRHGNVVPVVAAHAGADLRDVREEAGEAAVFLYAGVGAQGGDPAPLRSLLNRHGRGVFVNSSRGLLYPAVAKGEDWERTTERAVHDFKESLSPSSAH